MTSFILSAAKLMDVQFQLLATNKIAEAESSTEMTKTHTTFCLAILKGG